MRVEITVPLEGDAQVRMTFAPDNRAWLRAAVGTRRPVWERDEKYWRIPRAAAPRVYDAATDDGRSAKLTRIFRPDTEKCTGKCQRARLDTRNECTCICGGAYHGQSSPGWTTVGNDLLVRRGAEGTISQTIFNGIRAPGR